ncbi:MAG: MvaI/BcnI restriction endonuclease family protein [Bacilli bacterium]|nr:MvaI/BcnI restriction endonuclease family protein [Bacilli bacterium]
MKPENINKSMEQLKLELYKIQCKNWIPSKGKGTGAAGITLEKMLHKDEDQLVLPDYYGIELKTKIERSEPFVSLFSMAFDNKPLEIKRLLKIGGYPDKKNPQFKVFQTAILGNRRKFMKSNLNYLLKVDYIHEVVRLIISDYHFQLIDNSMSWSFLQLKSRLEHKMSYLALIPVKRWHTNGTLYFRYLNAKFFRLKNFETFLKLIETGIIRVTFRISYFKDEERFGEIHDRGTTFEIREEDIPKLFDEI